jgi:hypothetical protein
MTIIGFAPVLPAIILQSIPSDQQSGTSTIEAFAVNPSTKVIVGRASVLGQHQANVSGWSFAPEGELALAVRDGCGTALRRVVAEVEQGHTTGVPLDVERLVFGQKMRFAEIAQAPTIPISASP